MSEGGEEKKMYGTFEGGSQDHHHHHHQQQYPPQTSIGYPQPVPPPGLTAGPPPPPPPHAPQYYAHGYQAVPGYVVAEGTPVRERRLPCCGIGIGWLLFILGFFFAAIPWYAGAVIILCSRVDYREKPGYVACTIAAVLATIAVVLGVTKGADAW